MRKLFNKLFATIISISLVLTMSIGVVGCSCKDNGDEGSTGPSVTQIPEEEPSLVISATSYNLVIGDITKLEATTNELEGWSVYFQSSDPKVATVNAEGEIEAVSEGTTNVKVTYTNNKKAINTTCSVNVGLGGMSPQFSIAEGYDFGEVINMYPNKTLAITPVVSFNGREFTDATFEYEIETGKENVIGYNATTGVITSKNVEGVAKLTIKAVKWRNKEFANLGMQNQITINVENTTIFTVNDNALNTFKLYTRDSFDGVSYNTSTPFVAKVKESGEIKNVTQVKVADTSIVEYDEVNKKLVQKAFGETTISLAYENENNKIYRESVKVEVIRPTKVITEEVQQFITTEGEYRLEDNSRKTLNEFVGDNEAVFVTAYENGKELTISNNKIFGVTPLVKDDHKTVITVGTKTECYEITMVVYKHVIYEASDLKYFEIDDNYEGDGYWLLAQDIDATGVVINHSKFKNNYTMGFTGVLDGAGHTIFNFAADKVVSSVQVIGGSTSHSSTVKPTKTDAIGLMAALNTNATVKDLGFEKMNATDAYYLACEVKDFVTIQDCYFGIDTATVGPRGIFNLANESKLSSQSKVTNCVVNFPNTVADNGETGEFIDGGVGHATGVLYTNPVSSSSAPTFTNVYVLSPYVLSWYNGLGKFSDFATSTGKLNIPNFGQYYASNQKDTEFIAKLYKKDDKGTEDPSDDTYKRITANESNIVKQTYGEYANDPNKQLDVYYQKEEGVFVNLLDICANAGVTFISHNYFQAGVKAYDTAEDMSYDFKKNDANLEGTFNVLNFTSDSWKVVDGVPVFKSVDLTVYPTIEGVVVDETSTYSVSTLNKEYRIQITNSVGAVIEIDSIESSNANYIVQSGNNRVKLVKINEEDVPEIVEVTVNYKFRGIPGKYVLKFAVTKPVTEVNTSFTWSTADGTFDFTQLIPGLSINPRVTSASQVFEDNTKKMLTVNNGVIENAMVDIKDDKSGVDPIKISVTCGEAIYNLNNIEAYTKIIRTTDDLKVLALNEATPVAGYFILANNIDMAGGKVINHTDIYEAPLYNNPKDDGSLEGFQGIFDGRGYAITNYDSTIKNHVDTASNTTAAVGFFGQISDNAVIKNVAFTNLKSYTSRYFANQAYANITLENIYIELSQDTQFPSGIWHNASSQAKVKNMVIEYAKGGECMDNNKGKYLDGVPANGASVGTVSSGVGGGFNASNFYVISRYHTTHGGSGSGNRDDYSSINMERYAINDEYIWSHIVKFDDGSKIKVKDAGGIYNTYREEKGDPTFKVRWDGEATAPAEEILPSSCNISHWSGVKRYDTREAMSADAANNAADNFNVSAMDTTYWTVTNGVPTWNLK